ncbi:MAG TPA: response regulator [Kamptonema sp.]|nr:response regulator [Kamptonema sp.]
MIAKKILLIQKESNIQEVVQACLTDLGGWNVQVANSTLEGLQQVKIYEPDAIILEMSVCKIDELLFLKKLRSEPATQKVPVVLLILRSKWWDLQQRDNQPYQVTAVIVNPINPGMLSLQIANVLGWDLKCQIDTGI